MNGSNGSGGSSSSSAAAAAVGSSAGTFMPRFNQASSTEVKGAHNQLAAYSRQILLQQVSRRLHVSSSSSSKFGVLTQLFQPTRVLFLFGSLSVGKW